MVQQRPYGKGCQPNRPRLRRHLPGGGNHVVRVWTSSFLPEFGGAAAKLNRDTLLNTLSILSAEPVRDTAESVPNVLSLETTRHAAVRTLRDPHCSHVRQTLVADLSATFNGGRSLVRPWISDPAVPVIVRLSEQRHGLIKRLDRPEQHSKPLFLRSGNSREQKRTLRLRRSSSAEGTMIDHQHRGAVQAGLKVRELVHLSLPQRRHDFRPCRLPCR
jgi:hypothetical protein